MQLCLKHDCGFWGVPFENVTDLKDVTEEHFECCLGHDWNQKCSRNPRFSNAPDARDYFDPITSDELRNQILQQDDPAATNARRAARKRRR